MYDESTLLSALAAVVKTHANYDDSNVTVGDMKILSTGINTAVVVEEGIITSDVDEQYGYMAGVASNYNFIVYIYRKFVEDATSREDLRDDTQNVRTTIDGYHELNGNAESCKVISATAPVYIGRVSGSGPYFLMRQLTVAVTKIEEFVNLE